MCVLIDSEVLICNAFFAKSFMQPSYLMTGDLRDFCNMIYQSITKNGTQSGRYKYVYFLVDSDDMDRFCASNNNYVRGIDKIYALGTINEGTLRQINARYSKEVQKMLEEARDAFAKFHNKRLTNFSLPVE